AGRIGAVSKDDDGAAAPFALPYAPGGQRDGVVERGLAEGNLARQPGWQSLQADRARCDLVEMRVEGEDRGLVARGIEPTHDVVGRLSRILQMTFHATADVEQHRDADAGQIVPEVLDVSRLAPVEDFEITRREIRDESSFPVAN